MARTWRIYQGNKMTRINTEILQALNPCISDFKTWLDNYNDFDGDILDALELEGLSPENKIWVAVRLLPRELVEVFAIDCGFSAYASAAYASAAAYAADYAASAAAYASDYADYAASAAADYADYAASAAAYAAASATYADYAAYASAAASAASAADYAANYAASKKQERENQVDALIMLINEWED